MTKFISLMNQQTFYYLWQNNATRAYLERIIYSITKDETKYELLKTFNDNTSNLRSYIFLANKETLLFIDFNLSRYPGKSAYNGELLNFLHQTDQRRIKVIIFESMAGHSFNTVDLHYIFKSKHNIPEIKLLLSQNFKQQKTYDVWGIIDYLYNLGPEFENKYKQEIKREKNIYLLFNS